jgi:hypothetical protein
MGNYGARRIVSVVMVQRQRPHLMPPLIRWGLIVGLVIGGLVISSIEISEQWRAIWSVGEVLPVKLPVGHTVADVEMPKCIEGRRPIYCEEGDRSRMTVLVSARGEMSRVVFELEQAVRSQGLHWGARRSDSTNSDLAFGGWAK